MPARCTRLACFAVVLLWAGLVRGAEHHGVVTSLGLPVPGATVSATRADRTATTTTDERGAYSFSGLADGRWRMRVEMTGFGTVSATVDVSPVAGAAQWRLTMLPPGETATSRRLKPPPREAERAAAHETGAETQPSASANEPWIVTGGKPRRREGKTYNTSASLSLDNSAWDARAFSLTGQKQAKPSFARVQGSLVFAGPLRIPKLTSGKRTHFTLSYSAGRSRSWSSFTSTMPSALERSGDFSRSHAQGPVAIFDPLTGQAFPGGRIPASRIDSAAAGLLEYMPPANQPGPVQNYQYVTAVPTRYDSVGAGVNHGIGSRGRISGALSRHWNRGVSPQLGGFSDTFQGGGWDADLSWTHALGVRAIGTARLRFNRERDRMLPFFAYRDNVAAELGITGTAADPLNWGPPDLSFTNFGGFQDGHASLAQEQTGSVSENLEWNPGAHDLAFGFEYARRQLNRVADLNARGSFTFTGIATSALDAAGAPVAATGFDFADFLLGLPQNGSVRFGGGDNYFRSGQYGVFAQDDWRISSRVTLNVGLRYDYASPVREKYHRLANLELARGFVVVAPMVFPATLLEPDRNNFSPRLGIAWRPSNRRSTVIRAGYGWYFNTSVYEGVVDNLSQQPPFATSFLLSSRAGRVLTIRNGFGGTIQTQTSNTYAVDPRYRVGYAQSWKLSIQHTLGRALVGEISYLGTKGTRLDVLRIPGPTVNTSPFIYESSDGNSSFHGGNLTLRRRFGGRLFWDFQYTFAKSIDNAGSVGGSGGGRIAQDPRNLAAERGLSSFDNRHVIRANWRFSFRNWTLASATAYISGRPLTATVLGNHADLAGTGVTGAIRADATGLPVRGGGGLFNPMAFAVPPAARFGNAGRGTIPGPSQFVMNASVSRTFPLAERRSLEVRLVGNNVLNHVNLTGWGTVVNASNYGLATGAGAMRNLDATVNLRF